MKNIIFTYLIFNTFSIVHSQILKVDKTNIDVDSSNLVFGSVNVSFNINNQSADKNKNIVFKGLLGNADLVFLSKKNAYLFINHINYFSSTGGSYISTGYAHIRFNWLRKNSLSFENFIQFQYDDGRNMSSRKLLGGGIRFKVRKNRKNMIHIGTGLIIESEKWKNINENNFIIKNLAKNTTYISVKRKINDLIKLNGIVYFQSGFDKESNIFRNRMNSDFSVHIKFSNNLSFNVSLITQYETRPIIPINQWNYSFTNGLKWDF